MVSIARSFKLLIIDDNETDVKVVRRLIAKDYKSIEVVVKEGSLDFKTFLQSTKFDMVLLNYAAGSSVGLLELKKIIAVDEILPIYIMIWQHEIEVGMKAVYQGAEGFIIKDKTHLNLKKLLQRYLYNYSASVELAAAREINEIFSEAINDGFFRFTKDGDVEYISEKFIHLLGFETDFEVSTNVSDLFAEISEQIKKTTEFDKGISFFFETDGKDGNHFWFQVYVYKKFDVINDVLYFEGALNNISEARVIEQKLLTSKKENELLFNSFPLPIEVYTKAGQKLSSNNAFSKMILGTSATGREPLAKADVAYVLKDSIAKTFELKNFNLDNQKVVLGKISKYFDISYFASIQNPENIYAVYNDITENVGYKNQIDGNFYYKKALFNSIGTGFIEVNLAEKITDISEKTISILGKDNAGYINTPIYKFLDMISFESLSFAFQESKRLRHYSFTANGFLKISIQSVITSENEHLGYIIAVENNEQSVKLEETSKANSDRVNLFSKLKNIFLWIGVISENGIEPEYCSEGVTDITGYSVNEIMKENSKLTDYLFDIGRNNTLKEIIKYLDGNMSQEKNLIDRHGNIKRVRIEFHVNKEHATGYKISAIVENITNLSNQKDDYIALLSSINSIVSEEESLLFKTDNSLVVQEIYHCNKLFEKNITLHDKFQSFSKVDPKVLIDILEEALYKNIVSETILFSKGNNRRFKFFVFPYTNYAEIKSLYVYIKNITVISNISNDYNYYSKLFDSVKNIDSSLVLILENDTVVFANEAIKNLVNYKEEGINGLNITELLIDSDYSDGFSNKLPQSDKNGPVELLLKLKDKNSNQKICRFDVSVISGTEYPERFFLIGRDETENEEIKTNISYKSRLQNILSVSEPDAIIVWHYNEVIYYNEKFITLFGYSDKEIRELNKFDLFLPIQTDDIADILPTLFSDTLSDTMNGSVVEVICKKKQGEEFYAHISVSKHLLVSNNVFVLTVKDISETKRLENIIQTLNKKTNTLIASLSEGIWVFDNEYKITYLSSNALDYLDYSFEDVQDKRIFYFIKDGITDFNKRYFEESPEAKYLNPDVSFIKKDGTLFQTAITIVPLKNDKAQFTGGILAMKDLSDILDRDARIANLNEHTSGLDQQITVLTNELKDAQKLIDTYKSESEKLLHALGEKIESTKYIDDELDAAKKHLVRLCTIIQSNLKNQISNITGFANFMNKVWNNITQQQQIEYFNILLTGSQQASYTFDKVLLLSNVALNKLDIQREIMNVAAKIEKVLEHKLDKFRTKNISLNYNFDQNCYFNGDPKLIDFVINEVISNSLEYTKQDGEVQIEVSECENTIKILISDNGTGIAQDKLNNIFDCGESFKLNNSKNKTGAGLSLFIAREMLKLQEGSIEISSVENEGTKVLINLPADKKTIHFVGSESNSEILKNYLNSYCSAFSFVFSSDIIALIDEISAGMELSVIFLTAFLPEDEFIAYVKKLRAVYNKLIVIVSPEFSDKFKNRLLENNIFTFISLPLHGDNVEDVLAKIIHN